MTDTQNTILTSVNLTTTSTVDVAREVLAAENVVITIEVTGTYENAVFNLFTDGTEIQPAHIAAAMERIAEALTQGQKKAAGWASGTPKPSPYTPTEEDAAQEAAE